MLFIVAGCLSRTSVSSKACKQPPDVVEWVGKTYQLKAENTSIEPGMKYGWLTCANGEFELSFDDSKPATITVYSAEPHPNSEIIMIGDWGRVLYAPVELNR